MQSRLFWVSIKPLRKILAILLLVLFGLPAVSPLFALCETLEPSVPACCRANGRHSCLRKTAQRSTSADERPSVASPMAKCPFCPEAVASGHTNLLGTSAAGLTFAGLASHPAAIAQTESKRRIARDRSRQMRGPPEGLSS